MRMWVYVVRRVLLAVPVLIGVMTVLFVLISALPDVDRACAFYAPSGRTSPCTTEIPCPTNPSALCPNPTYQSAVNALGLNQPVVVQWGIYVENSLTFQWGYVGQGSALGLGETNTGLPVLAGHPVASVIGEFLPYSLELLLLTLAITFLVVVPLHSRATEHPGGAAEYGARTLTISGFGISLILIGSFALCGATWALGGPAAASPVCGSPATVLFDLVGSWPQPPCPPLYGTSNIGPLGFPIWLNYGAFSSPTGFPTIDAALHGQYWLALDTVFRMLVPALLLALVAIGAVFRTIRYDPTDRADLEFLRRERARGLPEARVFPRGARRYIFSATLPGLVPAFVWSVSYLAVVEIIFNLWGIGRLFAYVFFGGVNNWDYGILFGVLLLVAFIVVAVDIFAGSLRAYLDPRFRRT